jgi:hypothetical protein
VRRIVLSAGVVAVLGTAALGAAAVATAAPPEARLQRPLVVTQEPLATDQEPDAHCSGCRIVRVGTDGTVDNLTEGFASACDPAVGYDGTTLLFAGKRTPTDRWSIYELDLSSEERTVVQLTEDLGDCTEPLYLARASVTPPTFEDRVRWITFVSTAAGELRADGTAIPSLYAMSREPVAGRGTVLWRTTYNLGGDSSPTVMADGRILFASSQWDRDALLTITWAGDNPNPFYGTYGPAPPAASQPCELAHERLVVFIEPDEKAGDGGGRLVRLSMRRPMHSRTVLGEAATGRYRTPQALPGGGLVAAYTDGSSSYRVVTVDPETGVRTGVLFDDPEWHDVDAMALTPHPEPIARIPMLELASVLDIPGFEGAGQLHCMSVYDTDREELTGLERGEVRWARFIEGLAVGPDAADEASAEDEWPPAGVATRVLGEAPVEPDGSFFVNAPGNVTWYIELLDADRNVISTMRAWAWVRSASQRGCVGCHADPELTPRNRATDALRRMAPTSLMAGDSPTVATGRGGSEPVVEMVAAHEPAGSEHGGDR